jgi:predicted nucleotidyltransferase
MSLNGGARLGELLNLRREQTATRFEKLRQELGNTEELCADTACVYATGSFARGEANQHSDLDLFIVGKVKGDKRALGGLNEILIRGCK